MIPNFITSQRATRTDIFDSLPSIAAEAAYAIHAKTGGVDEGLIRSQLIAAMAAAVAPLYRLSLPGWHAISLDLPMICIGRSGISKTPVFRVISEAFVSFANERECDYRNEVNSYEAQKALREIQQDELKKEIRRKKRCGEDWREDERELERTLMPIPQPKLRKRLYTEVDFEKLVHILHGENEAVDLFFNEGDQAIRSVLFKRHAGAFNDLHDGLARLETPQQRRKVARATNSNVSRLFLLRDSALEPFRPTERNGKTEKSPLVDVGFFARCLVYFADQLPRNSGLWAPTNLDVAISMFNQLILDLLKSHHAKLVDGDTSRIELQLAPDAVAFWNQIRDDISAQRSQCFSPIDEYLGKIESLIARLAAIFHVLESDSDYVSLSALQRAWQIVAFHVPHYERAFAPPSPPQPPKQAEQDMYALAHLCQERQSRMTEGNYSIEVEECVVRLNISKRRVLHAASKLEDLGRATITPDREVINFRNLMRPISYISDRF